MPMPKWVRKRNNGNRNGPRPISGVVWCDRHGEIHDDTLNPYQYEPDEHCKVEEHHKVFVYGRMDAEF